MIQNAPPYSYYRETALYCGLTYEEEILIRNLIASIDKTNATGDTESMEGVTPIPEKTKTLFNKYAQKGHITQEEEKN